MTVEDGVDRRTEHGLDLGMHHVLVVGVEAVEGVDAGPLRIPGRHAERFVCLGQPLNLVALQ